MIKVSIGTSGNADGSLVEPYFHGIEHWFKSDPLLRSYVDIILQAKTVPHTLMLVVRCDSVKDGYYRPRLRQHGAWVDKDDAWLSTYGSSSKPLFIGKGGKLCETAEPYGRFMITGSMDVCGLDRNGNLLENALYITKTDQDELPAEFRIRTSRDTLAAALAATTPVPRVINIVPDFYFAGKKLN